MISDNLEFLIKNDRHTITICIVLFGMGGNLEEAQEMIHIKFE